MEVDNFYLKEVLGLGDFRLQSFEAAEKWFALVVLAMNFLQFRAAQAYLRSRISLPLVDFIRQHRLEHLQALLRAVIQEARQSQEDEVILAKFLPIASSLVTYPLGRIELTQMLPLGDLTSPCFALLADCHLAICLPFLMRFLRFYRQLWRNYRCLLKMGRMVDCLPSTPFSDPFLFARTNAKGFTDYGTSPVPLTNSSKEYELLTLPFKVIRIPKIGLFQSGDPAPIAQSVGSRVIRFHPCVRVKSLP